MGEDQLRRFRAALTICNSNSVLPIREWLALGVCLGYISVAHLDAWILAPRNSQIKNSVVLPTPNTNPIKKLKLHGGKPCIVNPLSEPLSELPDRTLTRA